MNGPLREMRCCFGRDAWLVCYDITDPRRLGRIHGFMKRYAMPVQYSVFLGWFPGQRLTRIIGGLVARMEVRRDDIRCYRLPAEAVLGMIGRDWMPEGAALLRGEGASDGSARVFVASGPAGVGGRARSGQNP